MLPNRLRCQRLATSYLLPAFLLGACATPHLLTRANEQQSTTTITFYNQQLNTSLMLNGDYALELKPRNRPDAATQATLRQLAVPRKQAAVLFTGHTTVEPAYQLRALRIAGSPNWAAAGFQETGQGRFQRTTATSPDLRMEYAAPLPDKQGWLYLLATNEAKTQPAATVESRSREMDAEFVTFTFPSVQTGRWPRTMFPGRMASSAFLSQPNGNYLAPLVALAQSRHSPADPSLDGTLLYTLLQYHALAGNTDSVAYFQRLGSTNIRLPAAQAATAQTRPRRATSDTLVSVEAIPEILRRTATARAVLLDESPIRPQHRALAMTLLPGLYQQGFRYLALEALEDSAASTLSPLPLQAGLQTREATLANLVRTARRLGFTLIAYNTSHGLTDKNQTQAAALHAALRQDAQARVLIYGATPMNSQLVMQGQSAAKSMPEQFTELTGWPVLRINQSQLSNDAISKLPATMPGTAEVVYRLRHGQRRPLYPGAELAVRNNFDIQQLPLPYAGAGEVRPASLDLRPFRPTAATGRRLVQLYPQSELAVREDIAPILVHEVQATDDVLPLRLAPGRYTYRVVSEKQLKEVRQELVVQ
ncbi:hypothetical protein ACFPAF_17350 [Hymenobacter endophyticus]|uniref:Uncharacterized protein n=1 Tax=Hymenobacter endophyticus TaxID=3076335 RepID=A0ABU3TLC8_9BACT|nr:hypothetical protein [Hymenobacter endophyticus]MDU0372173.1 hypothetical protein [Hymenobacter endophyticus]